ncbi:MAG: YggS family pyridoxal phosphate-dependent enzyme [Leptospira sp.]|nr:YggS family pyridoxal phosphate-dependent enzyme [Leptospira sp.]
MNFYQKYQDISQEISKSQPQKNILIIAVSKKHSYEVFEEAYKQGIRDFGENSIQEGLGKIERWRELNPDIAHTDREPHLHHIGPVQKGSLRKLFGNFVATHGVGSMNNWKELAKRSLKESHLLRCFIQLNLTLEDTKSGFLESEFLENISEIHALCNEKLIWEGLMTMGPSDGDIETTRNVFRKLQQIRNEYIPDKKISMGMTGDYKIAVEEGSDIVRIGTAIFGERKYIEK